MKWIASMFLIISAAYVEAHPVIYKDGWVFQGTFMPKMSENYLGYSFDPNFAVVAKSNSFENKNNYRDYTFGLNTLLKRWLFEDSQANIYLGINGGLYQDDFDNGLTGHGFVMADWEDRDHYVMFRSRQFFYDNQEEQDYLLRYGFSPYVAGMNDLQTWFVVQAYYYKPQSREVLLTPMLRFFYNNVLWEIGSSTEGESFLTLMVHY